MEKTIEIFESANTAFLQEERELILSGVAERCLCASFKQYLNEKLKKTDYYDYKVDVEYNRNMGKIKTIINSKLEVIEIFCDIIIHSRGNILEQDNLIAIEMKKSNRSKAEKESDKERLIALTKDSFNDTWSYDGKTLPEHVCRYKLGVYYEVNTGTKKAYIEYYQQGRIIGKYTINL